MVRTLSVITILQIIASDSLAGLRLHLVHNESKNPGHGDGNVFVRLFLLSFASHCIKLDFKSGLSRSVTKPAFLRWESVLNLKFGFAARNATAGRDFSPPFRLFSPESLIIFGRSGITNNLFGST